MLHPHRAGLSTFQRSAVLLESNAIGMFCPFLILAGTIHSFWKVFASGLRAFMHISCVQDTLAQNICQNNVEERLLIAIPQRKSNIIGMGKHTPRGGLAFPLQSFECHFFFFMIRYHVGCFSSYEGHMLNTTWTLCSKLLCSNGSLELTPQFSESSL